jgi:hypothetical protein
MTKKDIIRMAQEAGFAAVLAEHASEYGNGTFENTPYPQLEAFAHLVAAHKTEVALAEAYRCGYRAGMEAAAVICENLAMQQDRDVRDECAAAIRARGENT